MIPPDVIEPRQLLERVNAARSTWFLAVAAALLVWIPSCSTSTFADAFDGRCRRPFTGKLIAYETPDGVSVAWIGDDPPPAQTWIDQGLVGLVWTREMGPWGRTTRQYSAWLRAPAWRDLTDAEWPAYRASAAAAVERMAAARGQHALRRCAELLRQGVETADEPILAGWVHTAMSLASGVVLFLGSFRLHVLGVHARQLQVQIRGECPACGYDCNGCAPSACCPECGDTRA